MNEAKPFCISKKEVWEAYKRVKANKGAAGVDEQSIEGFEKRLKKNLYKIWNRMSSGSYFPPPVRTVKIPKKNGGERRLGIPTVSDRIAQQVVKARLEPKLEPLFHADSYGYRPGKSALNAVGQARERCWRYDWVIDLDIKGFFDNLDQKLLLRAVKKHAPQQWVVLYIERWLKAPAQEEAGRLVPRERGTPQGGVVTPLTQKVTSNLNEWSQAGGGVAQYLTFALRDNMFMTDDSIDQSGQGSTVEHRSRPARAPYRVARGGAAFVTRVRPVRASSISVPGGSLPSRPAGRSHGGYGADHAQASAEHSTSVAEVCEKQWPDYRSNRDTRVERVSWCSKKAWLSRAQEAARFKSTSTMRLIACASRSSPKPTIFWCPVGSALSVGV
jgi:Reverse transcriptase (RNA-dependent DNA polymerase)